MCRVSATNQPAPHTATLWRVTQGCQIPDFSKGVGKMHFKNVQHLYSEILA